MNFNKLLTGISVKFIANQRKLGHSFLFVGFHFILRNFKVRRSEKQIKIKIELGPKK